MEDKVVLAVWSEEDKVVLAVWSVGRQGGVGQWKTRWCWSVEDEVVLVSGR